MRIKRHPQQAFIQPASLRLFMGSEVYKVYTNIPNTSKSNKANSIIIIQKLQW